MVPGDHDDRGSVWTHARAVAIVARTRDAGDVDRSCVGPGSRCGPDRPPGPCAILDTEKAIRASISRAEVHSLSYTDRAISCVDCGQEFVFTSGEQEFYAQRGFSEAPKRCTSCRAARKAQRNGAGGTTEAGEGSYGGYGQSSGGYGGGGYSERRPREMFAATCADCGRTAQVPFQPTGARPVYCSDCFQTRR
jgi:CxxC-x17-CxxC domain-containing protein